MATLASSVGENGALEASMPEKSSESRELSREGEESTWKLSSSSRGTESVRPLLSGSGGSLTLNFAGSKSGRAEGCEAALERLLDFAMEDLVLC